MTTKPNILLILTDQHRLSAVGAYGPTPCRTPNIDRLAADGVRFGNAYTTCPVCTPARGSVLTGTGVLATIRHDQWKYGWNSCAADELYDLKNDPHETHNLSRDESYAGILSMMRGRMGDWMGETRMPGAAGNMFRLTSRD